jgi:hypothetical protein
MQIVVSVNDGKLPTKLKEELATLAGFNDANKKVLGPSVASLLLFSSPLSLFARSRTRSTLRSITFCAT